MIISDDALAPIEFIPTGVAEIDAVLGGGVPVGSITEIYGPPGSGKTQFCLQLCVQQLRKDVAKCGGVLYITSEHDFCMKRFLQMSQPHNLPSIDQGLTILKVTSAEHQLVALTHHVPYFLRNKRIGLIIVDSIAAHYRGESTLGRSTELHQIASSLKKIAAQHALSVLCTNQISGMDEGFRPALGKPWAEAVNTRLMIRKCGGAEQRELNVIWSPLVRRDTCRFSIGSSGLESID